jgi:hypothetical protein
VGKGVWASKDMARSNCVRAGYNYDSPMRDLALLPDNKVHTYLTCDFIILTASS